MIVLVCFKVTLTARGRQLIVEGIQHSHSLLLGIRYQYEPVVLMTLGGKSTGSWQDIPREKETTYIAVKKLVKHRVHTLNPLLFLTN